MSARLHYGLFADQAGLLAAANECKQRGLSIVDALTPYPIHGIDDVIGIRRSR
ncbi:MAG: quinol:electron acceptor oxidoreductase subunit ActD, partial [Planctomycetota bacterium]